MTRIRMTDHCGQDYAVRPYLTMRPADKDYGYRFGVFWSSHGIVDVYSQLPVQRSGRTWAGRTALSITIQGRVYHRNWTTNWPDRTIARLAREFADDVAGATG